MTQNDQKIKNSSNKSRRKVAPTERTDFTLAISMDNRTIDGERLLDHDPKVANILLSFRNNQSGRCFPSHSAIAERGNMSVSKVRRSLERLAKFGWITVTKRAAMGGGLQTSNQYDMNFESACSLVNERIGKSDTGCSLVSTPPAQQWTPGVLTGEHPGCSLVNNELSEVNPVKEPSESNSVPACGGGPAEIDCQDGITHHPKAGNDNDPDDERTAKFRIGAKKAWDAYPKHPRGGQPDFESTFIKMAMAGDIKSSDQVIQAMRKYIDATDPQWLSKPVKFLEEHFKVFNPDNRNRFRSKVAI